MHDVAVDRADETVLRQLQLLRLLLFVVPLLLLLISLENGAHLGIQLGLLILELGKRCRQVVGGRHRRLLH
jgi:hypothetical protein